MDIFSKTLWEGPYIDLWSISHVLFGVVLVLLILFLSRERGKMVFVDLVIASVAWEFVEHFFAVFEVISNRIVDIIVTIFAGGIILFLNKKRQFDAAQLSTLIVSVLIIFIMFAIFGWVAYLNYR